MKYFDSKAVFSKSGRYRYAVWRTWDLALSNVLFIGLNPSTANAYRDDPTLRRCVDFAQNWGYGGVCIANLFALCATDPMALFQARDPVGPANNDWITKLVNESGIVVAAWGNLGCYKDRALKVRKLIAKPCFCLRTNITGEPAHPLYLPKSLQPKPL
ncbi:MAG: DUF1643 domain-containing protein [bacterium]